MSVNKYSRMQTEKLVILSLMLSVSIVISILETLIPIPIAVPGIKPGFANIITLAAVILFGTSEALMIITVRALVTAIYAGNITIFAYSFTGGLLAVLIMGILSGNFVYNTSSNLSSNSNKINKKENKVKNSLKGKGTGIAGISIAGAAAHNTGQLLTATLLLGDSSVFSYFPILMASSIVTGLIVGIIGAYVINLITVFKNFNKNT